MHLTPHPLQLWTWPTVSGASASLPQMWDASVWAHHSTLTLSYPSLLAGRTHLPLPSVSFTSTSPRCHLHTPYQTGPTLCSTWMISLSLAPPLRPSALWFSRHRKLFGPLASSSARSPYLSRSPLQLLWGSTFALLLAPSLICLLTTRVWLCSGLRWPLAPTPSSRRADCWASWCGWRSLGGGFTPSLQVLMPPFAMAHLMPVIRPQHSPGRLWKP